MKTLASRIDGVLIQAHDFHRFSVTAMAGGLRADELGYMVEEEFDFPTEAEAGAKFEELTSSGQFHTSTVWAYGAYGLHTEVDVWYSPDASHRGKPDISDDVENPGGYVPGAGTLC